jgi:hypothetical protein
MTIVACPQQVPQHRAGMLAALEDRNARGYHCFISVDPLHKAPADGRQVVPEFRLMQLQTVKVDDVHVGAHARHQPAAIGAAGIACIALIVAGIVGLKLAT